MSELNTYGLKPELPRWKLFDLEDGWQVMVHVQPVDDEDDDRWEVRLHINVDLDGMDASVAILAQTEAVARKFFDAMGDGPKHLQGVLDQIAPYAKSSGLGGEG